jgi:hypothetical protein
MLLFEVNKDKLSQFMSSVNRVTETRAKAKENYYNFDFETSTPKSEMGNDVITYSGDFSESIKEQKYRQQNDSPNNISCMESL